MTHGIRNRPAIRNEALAYDSRRRFLMADKLAMMAAVAIVSVAACHAYGELVTMLHHIAATLPH